MVQRICVAMAMLVAIPSWSLAREARVLWSESRDGSGSDDVAADVAADRRGTAVAVGYVRGSGGELGFAVRAHHAATGASAWEDLPELGADAEATAVAAGGGVAVAVGRVGGSGAGDLVVRAYAVSSGALVWSEVHDGGAEDAAYDVAILGRRAVVAGSVDGAFAVRTYDIRTGALLWEARGEGGVAGAVAIRGRNVVAAGSELRAYDLVTGSLRWAHAEGTDRLAAVALSSRATIVAGTWSGDTDEERDFLVRAYETRTGRPMWSDVHDRAGEVDRAYGVAVQGQLAVAVGSLRNPTYDDAVVRAYDVRTGRVLWSDVWGTQDSDEAARAVAIASNTVVVAGSHSSTSAVRAYDKHSGALRWEHDDRSISGYARAVAAASGRPWVVVAGGGTFLADPPENWDFSVRAYHLRGSSAPAGPRFVDQGDGTVLDRHTALLWEKKTAPGTGPRAVDAAYTWCADVAPQDVACDDPARPRDGTAYTVLLPFLNDGGGLAGYDDWRLPAYSELLSINLCEHGTGSGGGACLDPAFGPVASDWYWSSSKVSAIAVGIAEFDFGYRHNSGPARSFHVRAVRGTPTEPTG